MSKDDKLDAILAKLTGLEDQLAKQAPQIEGLMSQMTETRSAVTSLGSKLLGIEAKIDAIAQEVLSPPECMALGIPAKDPFKLAPVPEEA